MIEETLIYYICGREGGGGRGSRDTVSRRGGYLWWSAGQGEKKLNKDGNNRQTVIGRRIDIEMILIEETLIYNSCGGEGGGGRRSGGME